MRKKLNKRINKRPKTPPEVEAKLVNASCIDALEALVVLGCEKDELLIRLLSVATVLEQSYREIFGFESRDSMRRALRGIRSACLHIDRMNESGMGMAIRLGNMLDPLGEAPRVLRAYCDAFETSKIGPRQNIAAQIAKMKLVEYVTDRTRSPHDREVALIIGAVQDNEEYTTEAHKVWRSRDYPRLMQRFKSRSESDTPD